MQEALINRLHQYISENNPDLLLMLEEKGDTSLYLNSKIKEISDLLEQSKKAEEPAYVVEEVCMNLLTKDLRPSKFNYIKNILEEEFEYAFYNFQKSGTLRYEVINIITQAEEVFTAFDFNEENEDNRQLLYAVTAVISEYLSK